MYSQKNRNKSFIYEEEIDQVNREKILKKIDNTFFETHPELRDISLKLHGEDIKIDTEKVGMLYNFLRENSKDIKKKKIILPKWIERKYLDLYFGILSNGKFPKLDFNHTKKLIDVCEYFKNHDLINTLVSENILTNLDKFSCLKILKDYLEKLDDENIRHLYIEVIQRCFEMASKNIFYLINNHQNELALIKQDSLEEIIERYFESVNLSTNIDHSLIMRLMINLRKLNDIFELLENERRRSLNTFEKLFNEGMEPTIIWKIKSVDSEKGFYKESDEFTYENISFAVLNTYDNFKDVYQIAIKITKVMNDSQTIDNSNIIFSILSVCEIKELNYKSKINFNCIYNNSKAKVLITKIENFSKLFSTNSPMDFVLQIYLNLSYNFSSIFTHICKNFYEYHSLPSIGKIPKNVLNLIIKNKNLNVRNEDEKLFAIITHLSYKQSSNQESIEDLFCALNWRNISLDGLLEFILNEAKILLTSSVLQDILISEFKRRFREDNNSVPVIQSTEDVFKSKSPSYKNLNSFSKSKERIPPFTSNSFTNELVLKLITSRYESQYKNSVYSGHATTSSNTNSNINSQSNYHHKMHYISGQNSSRNSNNVMNDSKAPIFVLQDVNTSPTISEHSYLKKSQNSNKQTSENNNQDKLRKNPWKNNFIKVEKFSLKNNNMSKSQTPSKPLTSIPTPKKGKDKSAQPLSSIRAGNSEKLIHNNSSFIRNPQPMNYNKIYQKLKLKTNGINNIMSNSLSYGTFKVSRYDNVPSTERRKRNNIDNVFNSLMLSNSNNISPLRKEGYSKNTVNFSGRIIDNSSNNRYAKKPTTSRPKSVNIFNN